MKSKILILLLCVVVFSSCEVEEELPGDQQSNGMNIDGSIRDLKSGSINRYIAGYGGYKFELALTTAAVSNIEDAPVLQDSILSLVKFDIYTDNQVLDNGDYFIQLNEELLNTVFSSYYSTRYEIDEDYNETINIDTGILSFNKNDSNYELEFKGMDSLNKVIDIYYRGDLIPNFNFE